MQIICDTHVHCYDFAELPSLLNAASANFDKHGGFDAKVLFFTDGRDDRTWQKLRPLAEQTSNLGDWWLSFSPETGMVTASTANDRLYLAPARQVNSASRLEYLLLGCDLEVEDGIDDETLIRDFAPQHVVICPWGVGKWLGSRGRTLGRLLDRFPDVLMLGDNGGRPSFWSIVPQFSNTGLKRINGSDPLPIGDQLDRVGAYGIIFDLQSDQLTLDSLIKAIKQNRHENFGKQAGVGQFVSSQLEMRAR